MKKLLKTISKYRSELLLGLFLVIPLLTYFRLTVANLFFLSSCLLFWQLFNLTNKNIYKAILLLALGLVAAGNYYFSQSSLFTLVAVIFILIQILVIILLSKKNRTSQMVKKDLHSILIFNLGLITCLSIILSISANLIDSQKKQSLNQGINSISKRLPELQIDSMNKTQKIAKDPNINKLLVENKLDLLNRYSQNIMVSKGLTYLVIIDRMGNVLVRAHQPKVIGDNYFTQMPLSKTVYESGHFKSIESISGSGLFITTGVPIVSTGDQYIGAIFGGQLFNDTLAKNLADEQGNVAFLQNDQVVGYFTNESQINKIFHFSNLPELIGCQACEYKSFSLEDQNYSVAKTSFSNSKDEPIGTIVLIKKDNDKKTMQILAILMFASINIIIAILIISQKMKKVKLSTTIFNRNKIKQSGHKIILAIFIFLIGQFMAIISLGGLKSSSTPLSTKTSTKIFFNNNQPLIYSTTVKNYYHLGEQIDYKIFINKLGQNISKVNFKLTFSGTNLEVISIVPNQAICMPTELLKDSLSDMINFTCQINKEVQLKTIQPLAAIIFKPKDTGISNVQIDPANSFLVTSSGQELYSGSKQNNNYIILP